jgi:glutathione S-transferase
MSPIAVYSIPGSPYGRAVLATLEEKQLPYRLCPLTPGAHRSEPYVLIHPFAKIPAIEHDGFKLYETQAILRYLDRLKPLPALAPADLHDLARMDQIMNINDCYLFQGVGDVIGFERVVAPRLMGATPDEAAIAAAMPKAHRVFAELSRLMGDGPFFAGQSVSLADLMLAPHMEFLFQTPEWHVLTAQRHNIANWMERMNERPSMIATTWTRVAELAKAA